jgi:hypothetical protein
MRPISDSNLHSDISTLNLKPINICSDLNPEKYVVKDMV